MWRLIHLQRLSGSVTYYSISLNFLGQKVEPVYSIQLAAGVCFLLGLFLLLSNLMSGFFGDSFLNVSIHMHVFHIVMGLPYSEKHRVSQNTFCQYLLMKALTQTELLLCRGHLLLGPLQLVLLKLHCQPDRKHAGGRVLRERTLNLRLPRVSASVCMLVSGFPN